MKVKDFPLEFDCSQVPDARTGFCNHCQETVYDLSAMSKADARAFVSANPTACIQFDYDSRNNLVFARSNKLTLQIRSAQNLVATVAVVPLMLSIGCEQGSDTVKPVAERPIVESDGVAKLGAASLSIESSEDCDGLPKKTRPTSSYDGHVTKPKHAKLSMPLPVTEDFDETLEHFAKDAPNLMDDLNRITSHRQRRRLRGRPSRKKNDAAIEIISGR